MDLQILSPPTPSNTNPFHLSPTSSYPFHHSLSLSLIPLFLLLSFFFVFCNFPLSWRVFSRCKCEICHSYLTQSWRKDFPNLSDWYSHLLGRSPAATLHLHSLNNLVTASPAIVEHLLKNNFKNYPKGKTFSLILGDLLGNGIFNVDGHRWVFQRKTAAGELGSCVFRRHAFWVLSNEIEFALIPMLVRGKGEVFDLQVVLRRFTFDVMAKLVFGLDLGCLNLSCPLNAFADAFDKATHLSARRALGPSLLTWQIQRILRIGAERELRSAIDKVDLWAKEVIKEKRKLGFSTGSDILSRFMADVADDDKYLRDIVVSFILAGRDTVAAALVGFFYLVAGHPEVKGKILEEMGRAMGDGSGSMTLNQVRSMHYLHAAVHESLRLYPPVQFDSKFALNDDVLPDGTFVKKGTRVTYHVYAMGRMESIWGPDCREFRPERWLQAGSFSPVNPFMYPVFQAGVRVCVGKELALLQMKSTIVALLGRFDIELVEPGLQPLFELGLTTTLKGGLPVRVRERACNDS